MIPANVKVGDYLKTRGGEKVKVLHVHRGGGVAVLQDDSVYTVHSSGRCFLNGPETKCDIIGPWVEPRRERVIVMLWKHEAVIAYREHDREIPRKAVVSGLAIAASEVELVEGQFPPGFCVDNCEKCGQPLSRHNEDPADNCPKFADEEVVPRWRCGL